MIQTAAEDDAAIGRNGGGLAEQVLKHGHARARRMRALRDLRELQRIAQQDDVARRRPHGERVGQRDLAGLVDHQRVDTAVQVLPREQPRGAGEEQDVVPGAGRGTTTPRYPSPSLSPRNARRSSRAAFSTSCSKLWMTLWLVAVTPTQWPRRIRCAMSRAAMSMRRMRYGG